jgi:hypothetical protein
MGWAANGTVEVLLVEKHFLDGLGKVLVGRVAAYMSHKLLQLLDRKSL